MRYLIGWFETVAMAALILSCRAAYWPSTMMIPSLATATVMFPPWPSSIYMLSPRSVVLISTLEKSGGGGGVAAGCCANDVPAQNRVVATAAIPVRSIKLSLAAFEAFLAHGHAVCRVASRERP